MTEYTLEIAGTEYPWVDLRYVRDYKFYGKLIEAIIPEWVAAIAGNDAITIKRDGATVTSGKIKKIRPFEGPGEGIGMVVTGYTKEMKHAKLLVNVRTYNADPEDILIDDIGSSDITDGTTNAYGAPIVVEFGSNDESKFSRKHVYDEVAFITGWEIYVNPTGALDFKSQCGVDRSASVAFKHGELLQKWVKPDMLNYLMIKTKVIVLGALEAEFEFYGIAGVGTDVKTIPRKNLIDDNTCALAAAAVYADMQNVVRVGVMEVIDTYEGAAYDVYDTVHVVDSRFDLDQNVRIYRIERHVGKEGEHTKIFYTNVTKLTCNGRFLLDLGKEELDVGQRVVRDFGRTVVNVIDKDALNAGGSVDFSKVGVVNKDHEYISSIGTGDHHDLSHKTRHVTGGADPLGNVSTGNHIHSIAGAWTSGPTAHTHGMTTSTGRLVTGHTTLWASPSEGGYPDVSFIAITSIGSSRAYSYGANTGSENEGHTHNIAGGETTAGGGGHGHNHTASPTLDLEEANEEDMIIDFIHDLLLPDGRRYVKINYPEFNQFHEVWWPVGTTDETIILDAKYGYHMLLEVSKNVALPENQPRPMGLHGKKIKWDIEKETRHMKEQREDDGKSDRRAQEKEKAEKEKETE